MSKSLGKIIMEGGGRKMVWDIGPCSCGKCDPVAAYPPRCANCGKELPLKLRKKEKDNA